MTSRTRIRRSFAVAVLAWLAGCNSSGNATGTHTPIYQYKVVATYPHDAGAFTQGLAFDDGVLYESTGLRGQSTLRKLDINAKSALVHPLPAKYFAEGLALHHGEIYQLTWKSGTGFVYDKRFNLLRSFNYEGEGWGLTSDDQHLIMSDGSAWLRFIDAASFKTVGKIQVKENGRPIDKLNELEYIRGEIYANVWETDHIARIDPKSGEVTAWIDLSGILKYRPNDRLAVLNGIAHDRQHDRLFVTGKRWPLLFQIELVPPPAE